MCPRGLGDRDTTEQRKRVKSEPHLSRLIGRGGERKEVFRSWVGGSVPASSQEEVDIWQRKPSQHPRHAITQGDQWEAITVFT